MTKTSRRHKWARIIRFGYLGGSMAALYDPIKNIVRIDKGIFDALDCNEQAQLMFTEEDIRYQHTS